MSDPDAHPIHRDLAGLAAQSRVSIVTLASSVFQVTGQARGPRVVIMGGVHGDEPCGYLAVRELLRLIAAGAITIRAGTLVLAIGNEAALVTKTRAVGANLNRLFREPSVELSPCYERDRAEVLKEILRPAAYLLDLHAVSREAPPYIMCEDAIVPFASTLGCPTIVVGWNSLGDDSIAGDTENYVNKHGGVGITVENGQRTWEGGAAYAFGLAQRFLRKLAIIDEARAAFADTDSCAEPSVYHLFQVQNLEDPSFRYARPWKSFDFVAAGTVIGSDLRRDIVADEDCYIIMPAEPTERTLGEDLYVLGRRR